MAVIATEKEIIGSPAHISYEDYTTAVRLLGEGRMAVEPLITDRIPLADLLERGLHRLECQAAETRKVIVRPNR